MVHHQIHNYLDAPFMCLLDQCLHIFERSIVRINTPVIGYIITVIAGRGVNRHQPYSSYTQILMGPRVAVI